MATKKENKATGDIEIANELDVGGFVRHLAHEIANPLNAIMMNAELARSLMERGDQARASEAIVRLLSDCGRCGTLLRGLQYFGSSLGAQEPSHVSLKDVIDGATSTMNFEYDGALPEFSANVIDVDVVVDRAAIERALVAVLRNSAEAGATNVSIDAQLEKRCVAIEIRDNGPGMSESTIGRLSTSFYSSKRLNGNLGVGLALARELVRRHAGSMHVEPNTPAGLHVSIRLPLSPKK
ncbi:MAG: HAMP domain-containing sensor histidine kinase [Rudaea sp.]